MAEFAQELIDAIENHAEARLSAWFPHPYALHEGGPEVVHLTPARHIALMIEGNKCALGQEFDHPKDAENQIRRFLFTCSAGWDFHAKPTDNESALARWNERNPELNADQLIPAIREYWTMMFLDSLSRPWTPAGYTEPATAAKPSAPWASLRTTSFIASYVWFFWEHYGMSKDEVFETPYPQLFQLMLAVPDRRKNPATAADQYISADSWLQKQQEPKSDE